MLELARRNAEKAKISNVSFVESSITSIPLPSATVDCIISNCVINLVPERDKNVVFLEIFRLLKPGGRVAISDILAKKELPVDVKSDMSLYVGCIAGASQVGDYEKYLKDVGFEGSSLTYSDNLCRISELTDALQTLSLLAKPATLTYTKKAVSSETRLSERLQLKRLRHRSAAVHKAQWKERVLGRSPITT